MLIISHLLLSSACIQGFEFENTIHHSAFDLRDIAIADLDNDGNLDIIFADYGDAFTPPPQNPGTSKVAWYRNIGSGAFSSTEEIITESAVDYIGINSIAVADFDADGDLDVVRSDRWMGDILEFKNDGLGNFAQHWWIATDSSQGCDHPMQLMAEDLNGNGHPDLIWRNDLNIGFIQNVNAGIWGLWSGAQILDLSASAIELTDFGVGDLNQDGLLDLVTAEWFGQVYCYYGNGISGAVSFEVTWPRYDIIPFAYNQLIELADISGTTGLIDFYGARTSAPNEHLRSYINLGIPYSTFMSGSVVSYSDGITSLTAADIDQDGRSDAVYFESDTGLLKWDDQIIADLNGAPGSPTPDVREIEVADLNNDGELDIIVAFNDEK
jgi:hypothetical protein